MKPRINFVATIKDLLHVLRLTRNALEAQVQRLDYIEVILKILLEAFGGDTGEGAADAVESGTGPVALHYEIFKNPDESGEVSIEGGKSFHLGPKLLELFRFLAEAGKEVSRREPSAGWRSRTETTAFLEKRTGVKVNARYLNAMVWLLRKSLATAEYDRDLIQTHPERGIRFAYLPGEKILPPLRPEVNSFPA